MLKPLQTIEYVASDKPQKTFYLDKTVVAQLNGLIAEIKKRGKSVYPSHIANAAFVQLFDLPLSKQIRFIQRGATYTLDVIAQRVEDEERAAREDEEAAWRADQAPTKVKKGTRRKKA